MKKKNVLSASCRQDTGSTLPQKIFFFTFA
jgi:hypothetical protein